MNFGKFKVFTATDLVDLDKSYIRWVYYNMEWVTFTDSILKRVGIVDFISKPGIDIKKWKEIKNTFNDTSEDIAASLRNEKGIRVSNSYKTEKNMQNKSKLMHRNRTRVT